MNGQIVSIIGFVSENTLNYKIKSRYKQYTI